MVAAVYAPLFPLFIYFFSMNRCKAKKFYIQKQLISQCTYLFFFFFFLFRNLFGTHNFCNSLKILLKYKFIKRLFLWLLKHYVRILYGILGSHTCVILINGGFVNVAVWVLLVLTTYTARLHTGNNLRYLRYCGPQRWTWRWMASSRCLINHAINM